MQKRDGKDIVEKEKGKGIVFEDWRWNQMCLGRISSQRRKPGLKDAQERAMQGTAHTNKDIRKKNYCAESDAQPAVGGSTRSGRINATVL